MFLKGRGLTLFTTFYNHKTLDLEMNYCKIVFPHVIHLIYNIIILLFQRFDMDMNILFCRMIVKYIEQTKIYDIQTALFKLTKSMHFILVRRQSKSNLQNESQSHMYFYYKILSCCIHP